MGDIFALADEFIDLPLREIGKLLDSDIHEARAGALSIMGKQATRKSATDAIRKQLSFLDRHAATSPRVLLRYAIEHLEPDQRAHYLNLGRRQ